MTRIAAAVFLIAVGVVPASFGNPMPPGTCTPFIDDGVAGVYHVRGDPNDGPEVIAADIPDNANRLVHGRTTIDLSFIITKDGMAIAPKVLCAVPQADALTALILSAAPNWRFTPAMKDGKPVDSEAAYRFVVEAFRPMPAGVRLRVFPKLLAFVPED